jgi:hypothetical protein
MVRGWRWSFLMFAVAALVVGCGKGRPRMTVYPVSGKLTVAGKPAPGLTVSLRPKRTLADTRCVPVAIVGPDGSFTMQTYEPGDGAPAGEYSLFVSAPSEMSPTAPNEHEMSRVGPAATEPSSTDPTASEMALPPPIVIADDVRKILKKHQGEAANAGIKPQASGGDLPLFVNQGMPGYGSGGMPQFGGGGAGGAKPIAEVVVKKGDNILAPIDLK